jgi:hypothetical protein
MQPIGSLIVKPAALRTFAVLLVCFVFSGCANHYQSLPAPQIEGRLRVTVDGEPLSTMSETPIGAYKVPESDVVVTGHQRGGAFGAMFGLFGAAVAHAANSSSGAARVQNAEPFLRIKLAERTQAEIARAVADPPLATKFTTESGVGRLEVSSTLLLSYQGDTQVRPFVVLKAKLRDTHQKALWDSRYFASTGEARPLEGVGGWASNDGEFLQASIDSALRQAVRAMLRDVAQPVVRDDEQTSIVEGHFPYHEQRLQVLGYVLTEEDNYITFAPKLSGGMVISGIHVLRRDTATHRPARSDDSTLRVLNKD